MSCYVYGCKSNWNPYDDISFFKFPLKDENLLKKWFEVIPYNKNRKITKNSRICSQHFEESQYIYVGNKRVLKEGAIPVFPFLDNVETNVDEDSTPECDFLKDFSEDNNHHQCSIQEQEIPSTHVSLLSTTRKKIQATSQVDKAIQVISETKDIATEMSPERLQPSEIEEKLQQQINLLEKKLRCEEMRLSKIYQQLKHLQTEDKEKG
ncbi:THAP domain-containing protein 1-like [Linepithema humile]|uniref:THAP domain-containing protein 1-like n=1 Tax=Linepithema humile TaxID=83485 RepID=UPI0006230340|nr:PREDICTED: THAP domain-containing protein 1-like [Linepithema humile]